MFKTYKRKFQCKLTFLYLNQTTESNKILYSVDLLKRILSFADYWSKPLSGKISVLEKHCLRCA